MTRPLEGVRVLDLTRVLAGPWATQLLADMGADVIKVERPVSGDDTRGFPPFVNSKDGGLNHSIYFLSINRGKRSITIDLTKPEGQELVRQLAEKSDILIENYKAGSLAKLGLDYRDLDQRNPRLIYCSIRGFGQAGPNRERPGYDLVVQAMSGLMSITGEPTGPPMRAGTAIADFLTALYAACAILGALHERGRSGLGQHIDLALLDVQIATLANQAGDFLATGKVPSRHGNAHPSIVPYQDFETRDGQMIVAVANDLQFARFAEVLGMAHLADDPKYQTNAERVKNRDSLLPLISARLVQKSTSEWLAAFDQGGIPAGPINTLDAVFRDPQGDAQKLVVEFSGDHSPMRLIGSPIHFSRTPVSYEVPPPELGAHTKSILSEILGRSREEIERLRRAGVV
jgi:crotonobetainyl-CoA:carnitine CoA-transferase CaiB-like acyl-CoA transferase